MRETPTHLEITPRMIDLGDRIIPISQVTSARVGVVHPLRPLARLPLIAGGLFGVLELIRGTFGHAEGQGGLVSGLTVLALICLAVSALLYRYAVRRLVISTSDAASTLIRSSDLTFLRLVLDKIRTAMSTTDPQWHVSVDLLARTIGTEGLSESPSSIGEAMLRAEPARAEAHWPDRSSDPDLTFATGTAAHSSLPDLHSANGTPPAAPRDSFAEAMLRDARVTETSLTRLNPPKAAAPSDRRAEIESVVALIERARVPHKSELHALLDPVMDHVSGGRTSLRDAQHNWRLFHDYASKYLTDIDGLSESCRRVQASLA